MRPTLLNFRSPKERTPDCYNPSVTSDGRRISYSPERSVTIPHSARFLQYKEAESRTTIRVGPGTYENDHDSISKSQGRAVFRYTKPHCGKQTGNNGYYMVGDQLVFDGNLMSNRGKYQVTDSYCKVDETSVLSTHRTKASSRPHSKLKDRLDLQSSNSPRRYEAMTPLSKRRRVKRDAISPLKTERDKSFKEFDRLIEFRFKTMEKLFKKP